MVANPLASWALRTSWVDFRWTLCAFWTFCLALVAAFFSALPCCSGSARSSSAAMCATRSSCKLCFTTATEAASSSKRPRKSNTKAGCGDEASGAGGAAAGKGAGRGAVCTRVFAAPVSKSEHSARTTGVGGTTGVGRGGAGAVGGGGGGGAGEAGGDKPPPSRCSSSLSEQAPAPSVCRYMCFSVRNRERAWRDR
jgi:hypothetical protein